MALAPIIGVWKRNNRQVPHWRNVNKQTKITKTILLLQPLKSENGLKSSAMMTPMPRQKIWRLMLRIAPPPLRGRRAWGCMFKVLGVTPQPQVHVATRMNPAFVAEGWQLLCSFAPPHLWMFTGKRFVIKKNLRRVFFVRLGAFYIYLALFLAQLMPKVSVTWILTLFL